MHPVNDQLLAECSLEAYSNQSKAIRFEKEFHTVRSIDNGGTQAFVGVADSDLVIAFRGTEAAAVEDWVSDIRFRKWHFAVHTESTKVHLGFLNALLDVRQALWSVLAEYPQHRLYVTGHSLGAALATLFVGSLYNCGRTVERLTTFGSPRVGNKRFAKTIEGITLVHRYVNNNDVVTRVPRLGYWHAGKPIYFDSAGNVFQHPGRTYMTLDGFRGRLKDLFRLGTDGIKDHSMVTYCDLATKHTRLGNIR